MESTSDQLTSKGTGDDAGFSAAISALSSAFGDPSRRSIYLHLRANPHSTVTDISDKFDLHPNVVRHHLDRLVSGGYIEVEAPLRSQNAGRPAKRYVCAPNELSLELGVRKDDLLVALLERSLSLLGPDEAEAMATSVGEEYGRELASRMGPVDGTRSIKAAMVSVAEAMTAHGFAAHAELSSNTSAVVVEHCPFGEVAAHHPVLCAVDRGMVSGLLDGLGASDRGTEVQLMSRARGDDTCRATA